MPRGGILAKVDSRIAGISMTISYDPRTDTLTLRFSSSPIAESDEEKPGVILDFDQAGNLVALEILDASTRVPDPTRVDYRTAV